QEVISDVGLRVAQYARGAYGVNFLTPPTPRERLQRGQFQDAAKDLVGKQDAFGRGRERLRGAADIEQQVQQWVAAAAGLSNESGRAALNRDEAARAAALARIDNHWKEAVPTLLVDQVVAELGRAEATYLLALCKHEQAERLQARLENASGADVAEL